MIAEFTWSQFGLVLLILVTGYVFGFLTHGDRHKMQPSEELTLFLNFISYLKLQGILPCRQTTEKNPTWTPVHTKTALNLTAKYVEMRHNVSIDIVIKNKEDPHG